MVISHVFKTLKPYFYNMSGKVLIVDDLPLNRRLLTDILKREYYIVYTTVSGLQAINMVREVHPDIVIIDLMLPEMDGIAVTKIIRSDRNIGYMPIIMLTAVSDKDRKIEALQAGVNDFLVKSISQQLLISRIQALLTYTYYHKSFMVDCYWENTSSEILQENAKVAFISDNIEHIKYYQKLLRDIPLNITYFKQAITSLQKASVLASYSLIIIDGKMLSDPLQTCTYIVNEVRIGQIPVMLVMQSQDDRMLIKGLNIGICDYLVEPFEKDELLARCMNQIRFFHNEKAILQRNIRAFRDANLDVLTNTYTRKYFEQHLNNIMKANKLHNSMILVIDVDAFKKINDLYGHKVGDMLLKTVAESIMSNIRMMDLCARFGGEEFVVLLPNTPMQFCINIIERLLKAVRNASVKFVDHTTQKETVVFCTCSVGGKYIDANGCDDMRTTLDCADANLYIAKAMGKNCYVIN